MNKRLVHGVLGNESTAYRLVKQSMVAHMIDDTGMQVKKGLKMNQLFLLVFLYSMLGYPSNGYLVHGHLVPLPSHHLSIHQPLTYLTAEKGAK